MGSESQLAFNTAITFPRSVGHTYPAPGGRHLFKMVQLHGCRAVFELIAHEGLENWTSLSHSFTKVGLLQLLG